MLFDRDGLEMASHERIAAYHASIFPAGATVVDMTCGIGADTIALAARGPVVAYELSTERSEYARHNLAVHGLSADVRVGDAMAVPCDADYALCDPSRRADGGRLRRLDDFSPNPRLVAERMRSLAGGVMKLSPMLSDSDLQSFGGRLEFLSFAGECREALVVLTGKTRILPGPCRAAVHVETGAVLPGSAGVVPGAVRHRDDPQTLVFEADPAAIRGHCLEELCSRHDLALLGDSNGYLTGADPVTSPWLSGFEVLASHRGDVRRTKAELKRLGGGTPVVKSRAGVDVESLRKQWRGDGEEFAVLIYPVGRSHQHVVARRLN
jgi:hypothetical protein